MTYAEKMIHALENQELDKAEDFFNLSLKNDTAQDQVQLAEILLSKGFIQQAKTLYENTITHKEFFGESSIGLAEIYIEEGNDAEAFEELMKIPEESPLYIQSLLVQADLYQTQGLYEVSEQKLREAEQQYPGEPVIQFALGELLFEMGRYRLALVEYEKLVQEGYDEYAGTNLHFRMAECNSLVGNWEKAIGMYKEILEKGEHVDIYFQLALIYIQIEEYESAVNYLNQLKERDPFYTSLYPALIQSYEKLGNMEAALETLQEGLSNDQTNSDLFILGAEIYNKEGSHKKAIELLNQALSINPYDENARLLLSELMEERDELPQALDVLNQEDTADPKLLWKKAVVHEELEEYEEAGECYEKAAPYLSDNEEFLTDYLFFLRDEGNWEKASTVFKAAQSKKLFTPETERFLESIISKE